jgi:hypothetical protein
MACGSAVGSFLENTTDATTIKKIGSNLNGWRFSRALFMPDSRTGSEHKRAALSRTCVKYILATHMASVAESKKTILSKRGPYQSIK